MTNFDKVKEFHRVFGLDLRDAPAINADTDGDLIKLRLSLMDEELAEVREAIMEHDLLSMAKELADLLYVVYGTAAVFGIPIDDVFAEVHRSNMSKLGEDGKPVYREDGKVLKGKNYEPADVHKILLECAG